MCIEDWPLRAAFCAALCGCVVPATQPVDLELTVAVRALEDEVVRRPPPDTLFILDRYVAATASATDSAAWLEGLVPERFRQRVPPELYFRFWCANRRAIALASPAQIGGRRVQRVRQVREATIPERSGIYSLSRVGFSAGGDSALVMVYFACRGLCGSSDLHLYVLGANGWERRTRLVSRVH